MGNDLLLLLLLRLLLRLRLRLRLRLCLRLRLRLLLLASNEPSRIAVLFNILISHLSFFGSSVRILHGSKGDLTHVFCHHWWDINPEPCTRTVVQSLFYTHPSHLASKWEKLEAVNS